jgi:hypothetical protein
MEPQAQAVPPGAAELRNGHERKTREAKVKLREGQHRLPDIPLAGHRGEDALLIEANLMDGPPRTACGTFRAPSAADHLAEKCRTSVGIGHPCRDPTCDN